jgi:hypothetical protein
VITRIGFHDSTLQSAAVDVDAAVILLDAYVYRWELIDERWRGTGWSQLVRISIGTPAIGESTSRSIEIYDGCLEVGTSRLGGAVPLPFSAEGPVSLRISPRVGAEIGFSGQGVTVEEVGEASFIEDLPSDMAPFDDR